MTAVKVYVTTGRDTSWYVGSCTFNGQPRVGQIVALESDTRTLTESESGFYRVIRVDVVTGSLCHSGLLTTIFLEYLA
jgi:hypothetical protein